MAQLNELHRRPTIPHNYNLAGPELLTLPYVIFRTLTPPLLLSYLTADTAPLLCLRSCHDVYQQISTCVDRQARFVRAREQIEQSHVTTTDRLSKQPK